MAYQFISTPPIWAPGTYAEGQLVTYSGSVYICSHAQDYTFTSANISLEITNGDWVQVNLPSVPDYSQGNPQQLVKGALFIFNNALYINGCPFYPHFPIPQWQLNQTYYKGDYVYFDFGGGDVQWYWATQDIINPNASFSYQWLHDLWWCAGNCSLLPEMLPWATSQAYSKGSFVISNNLFYVASTNIVSGPLTFNQQLTNGWWLLGGTCSQGAGIDFRTALPLCGSDFMEKATFSNTTNTFGCIVKANIDLVASSGCVNFELTTCLPVNSQLQTFYITAQNSPLLFTTIQTLITAGATTIELTNIPVQVNYTPPDGCFSIICCPITTIECATSPSFIIDALTVVIAKSSCADSDCTPVCYDIFSCGNIDGSPVLTISALDSNNNDLSSAIAPLINKIFHLNTGDISYTCDCSQNPQCPCCIGSSGVSQADNDGPQLAITRADQLCQVLFPQGCYTIRPTKDCAGAIALNTFPSSPGPITYNNCEDCNPLCLKFTSCSGLYGPFVVSAPVPRILTNQYFLDDIVNTYHYLIGTTETLFMKWFGIEDCWTVDIDTLCCDAIIPFRNQQDPLPDGSGEYPLVYGAFQSCTHCPCVIFTLCTNPNISFYAYGSGAFSPIPYLGKAVHIDFGGNPPYIGEGNHLVVTPPVIHAGNTYSLVDTVTDGGNTYVFVYPISITSTGTIAGDNTAHPDHLVWLPVDLNIVPIWDPIIYPSYSLVIYNGHLWVNPFNVSRPVDIPSDISELWYDIGAVALGEQAPDHSCWLVEIAPTQDMSPDPCSIAVNLATSPAWIIDIYPDCHTCLCAKCYGFYDCDTQIFVGWTDQNLSDLNGMVISKAITSPQLLEPSPGTGDIPCLLVRAIDCPMDSPPHNQVELISYTGLFKDCSCCLDAPPPPTPFPTPQRVYPLPVKQHYTPTCDDKVRMKYAKGYWNYTEVNKYGISRPITDNELFKLWMKEQVNQLISTEDPTFNCNIAPAPPLCFPQLPPKCPVFANSQGAWVIVKLGEDVIATQVIRLGSDGLAYANQPLDDSTYQTVIGFAYATGKKGQSIQVIMIGPITIPGLTSGGVYYAAINGGITTTLPTMKIMQQVGIASSISNLVVDIQQAVKIT